MPTHYQGTPEEILALNTHIKLMRASNSVQQVLERQLENDKLSENQFGILEVLLHLGSLHQSELGQKLFTSKGNITHILENLEKRHLIERRKNPADKRQTLVELSPQGRQLVERLMPEQVRRIACLYAVLTREEQELLGELSKKLGLAVRQSSLP